MAFLTTCPTCGNPHVCSLTAEAGLRFKCRRCRSEYPAVRPGVLAARDARRFAEDDTLAESEPEGAGPGPAALVVVRHLPSLYPKRHRKRRRRRRQSRPVELVAAALLIELEPAAPAEPEPAAPVPAPPAPAVEAPPPRPAPRPPARRPRPTEDEDESLLRPVPSAVVALLLLAAALLTATVAPAAGYVRPLAWLGLLTGLYATGSAFWQGRRLTVPGSATALAATVLLASYVTPGLLGPGYRAARTPAPMEPLQVVPRPQFAGDFGLRQADWVDAGKAGFRQGAATVEVVRVWVGPPSGRGKPEPGAPDRALCVLLRLSRHRADLADDNPLPPPPGADHAGVALTDPAGRAIRRYPGAGWQAVAEEDEHAAGEVETFEATLVFAAPAGSPPHLRLELPGPVWGAVLPARFQIPRSLIRAGP